MSKENVEKQNILRSGMETEFWKIMVSTLEDFVVRLEKEEVNVELPADQYKLESEILKAKVRHVKKLIATPESMIEFFQNPETDEESWDPYS